MVARPSVPLDEASAKNRCVNAVQDDFFYFTEGAI